MRLTLAAYLVALTSAVRSPVIGTQHERRARGKGGSKSKSAYVLNGGDSFSRTVFGDSVPSGITGGRGNEPHADDFSRFAFGGGGRGSRIPDNTNAILDIIAARETNPEGSFFEFPQFFSDPAESPAPSESPLDTSLEVELREGGSLMPSDFPSQTPSSAPSLTPTPTLATEARVVSDRPSLVPSAQPSNDALPREGSVSASVSDRPSLVPSSQPSSVLARESAPSGDSSVPLSSDVPSTVPSDTPSSVPSDTPSGVPSTAPSDYPSVVPTSYPETTLAPFAFSRLGPADFVMCDEEPQTSVFGTAVTGGQSLIDYSSMEDITVQYWYNLQAEDSYDTSSIAVSQLVDSVEVALLESVQEAMCGTSGSDRKLRRLSTENAGFSTEPTDLRLGTCGTSCYPIYGGMKVKVGKSVAEDADKYGALYCGMLEIIRDAIGTSAVNDLTGIESTVFLDRSGPYTCDFSSKAVGTTRVPVLDDLDDSKPVGDNDDEGVPIGVTMTFVMAGGLIACTALFIYGHKKKKHHGSADVSVDDLDTTFRDTSMMRDAAVTLPAPVSPMSALFDGSVYTTDDHADDHLLMANSGESWTEVDLGGSPRHDAVGMSQSVATFDGSV